MCGRKSKPYSEVLTHEAVDDGVGEAVGHRDPVAGEEGGGEVRELRVCLRHHLVGVEVDEQVEDVDGQPANGEQDHHREHHLHHLHRHAKAIVYLIIINYFLANNAKTF
ncbi:uncharacterized protein CDAR_285781 [Caerostris darwini]|uniref:Uncharacterized protein n=1 Tax=Caerostris darwini TaxID=1538125 RepID=A0AAV4SWE9_9ARAC|nr:uncharacterized protein CDAR_285781 [Caerostris darwini]